MSTVIALAAGILLGIAVGWLIWGRRLQGDNRAGAVFEALGKVEKSLDALRQQQQDAVQAAQRLEQVLKHSPGIRGRWGEIQLRRLVELAGMLPHVDFLEQPTTGEAKRPDLVVRLPGRRALPVDAKVPLQHYFDACATEDGDARREALRRHCEAVKQRVRELADRRYWEGMPGDHTALPFTVLYLPVEPALAAAYEWEQGLFEYALDKRVMIATPTTFMAMLHAVAYGWQQQQAAENAARVLQAVRDLHSRLRDFCNDMTELAKRLNTSVDYYNRAVGSLEQKLMPSVHQLQEMGVVGQAVDMPPRLDRQARPLILPPADGVD